MHLSDNGLTDLLQSVLKDSMILSVIQIKLLEEELGIELFERSGKHLVAITPIGKRILEQIEEILALVDGIKHAATEFSNEDYGSLAIATTHTQAKFTLPPVVDKFVKKYPNVSFQMNQCTPDESVEMAAKHSVEMLQISDQIYLSSGSSLVSSFHLRIGELVKSNLVLTI